MISIFPNLLRLDLWPNMWLKFPSKLCFCCIHPFWYLVCHVFLLLFISEYFLFSLVTSLTNPLFRSMLFNFHILVDPQISFFIDFEFNSTVVGEYTSHDLRPFYRGLFCGLACDLPWRMFHVCFRRECIHSTAVGESDLQKSIRSSGLIVMSSPLYPCWFYVSCSILPTNFEISLCPCDSAAQPWCVYVWIFRKYSIWLIGLESFSISGKY